MNAKSLKVQILNATDLKQLKQAVIDNELINDIGGLNMAKYELIHMTDREIYQIEKTGRKFKKRELKAAIKRIETNVI